MSGIERVLMVFRCIRASVPTAALVWVGVALPGTPLSAQEPPRPMELSVTRDGLRLDFPADGVWRVKARQVMARRAALRSQGDFSTLNTATAGAASETAVTGTFVLPSVLVAFADTDLGALPDSARYDSLFYGTTPPAGRTYSLGTFYDEVSAGLLTVTGTVHGWHPGDSVQSWYLEACGPDANALDCTTGRERIHALFVQGLDFADAVTDFGEFDNDGPDGVPNSGDDDGFVDLVQFVQPVLGGECGGRGVWAHRFFLSSLGGSDYTTNDAAAGGGSIRINSYFVASGVGGAGAGNRTGCGDAGDISGIGTAAHEFGHGLALPDLYDTSGETEGIGEWGLMGSGNFTSANSPAHYDAWSKEMMGWVTVRPATTSGTYTLGPVVTADTIFLVRPVGDNPRGEYVLLENKQATGADTANMLVGGNAGPKVGGLLIWHVDSTKVAQAGGSNTVNAGAVHGVALVQADGANHLRATSGGNRGDDGDPYPGSSVNDVFSDGSTPAAVKNADSTFMGFAVDSIRQVTPGGAMVFRILFDRALSLVLSGPGEVEITSDGGTSSATTSETGFYDDGETLTLVALPDSGGVFGGWGGDTTSTSDTLVLTMDRSVSIEAPFATRLVLEDDTIRSGVMGAPYADTLRASAGETPVVWQVAGGTLPAGMSLDSAGRLGGVPEETGDFALLFEAAAGFQADSLAATLTVTAPALAVETVLDQLLAAGTGLTADEIRFLDLLGNRNGGLDVGDVRAWVLAGGPGMSAAEMAQLLADLDREREGGGR